MKVRIKVLIDAEGNYAGYGFTNARSLELDDTIYEAVPVNGPVQEYWLTADLPLPSAIEVEATVTSDGTSKC